MELVILRHGATPGNEQRRYVGVLDHPLSPAGREQARAAGICNQVKHVFVTPLRRTHETAALCFPQARQIIVDGLQEMNFGDFGGRSADEMADDAAYREWVDGMCLGRCPQGESRADFSARICRSMTDFVQARIREGAQRVILVAHGGTIMAALDAFSVDYPDRDYYEWLVGNCEGYRMDASVDGNGLPVFDACRHFSNLAFLSA